MNNFNAAIAGQRLPKYPSMDHDPLFRFHGSRANLRVYEIDEGKSVPYVPTSHPFAERLNGSVRRAYLDRVVRPKNTITITLWLPKIHTAGNQACGSRILI